jgi:hypothetical protein
MDGGKVPLRRNESTVWTGAALPPSVHVIAYATLDASEVCGDRVDEAAGPPVRIVLKSSMLCSGAALVGGDGAELAEPASGS